MVNGPKLKVEGRLMENGECRIGNREWDAEEVIFAIILINYKYATCEFFVRCIALPPYGFEINSENQDAPSPSRRN
jgi:hypothetical protein